jgi:hypothetical protein
LVTELTAVMKTIICSQTLQLPTAVPNYARFPRQSVRTDRERCSGGAQGMVRGRDREDPGLSDEAEERRRLCLCGGGRYAGLP